MALVQKSFSDIITFSRSSNATRVGPTGLVEYAPHNLILQSQTFDNASWTKSGSSVTANANSAPDGTVTGDKLIEDTSAGYHQTYQTASVTSGVVYTFSVYAKAAERTKLSVFVQVTGATAVTFDLSAGSYVIDSGSVTATITSVGNGWYRCSVTATATATGTGYFNVLLNNGSTASYTGDGTSGIYIWGAQLSVGPYALDYTPTTSAAVYGPRFDYDGSGVTIVEPVSRNLLTYSEQFDNAAWNMISGTVTANSIAAPDGTITADKYTPSATTAFQLLYQVASTFGTYTFSIYAKAGEYTQAMLWTDKPVAFGTSAFNLSNGTVFQQGTGHTNVSITSVGNGWYRCSITATSTSGTPTFYVGIAPSGNTGGTFAGNGTSGGYLWGAQLEVGSTATGYMVSGATNGFRAVPVVSGSATARGLLVEEQRTNLLTYSEQFGSWATAGGSVSSNTSVSPDGQVTGDTYTISGAGDYLYNSASVSASTTYTMSIFIKAGTKSSIRLYYTAGGFSAYVYVDVNPSAGTIGTPQSAGGATAAAATIQSFGSGWYRVTLTGNLGATTTAYAVIGNDSGSGTVLVWGAQLESGSFATSLIPTLASTVTRSADVASVNTLSPWWNATESTIYSEFDTFSTNDAFPYALGTKNNNEVDVYRVGSNGNVATLMFTSTVLQNNSTIATGTALNATIKAAYAIKANDLAASANGGAVVTDTSATLPSVSTLYLGAREDGTGSLNGHLRRLAVYPRRLTNAELQALTA